MLTIRKVVFFAAAALAGLAVACSSEAARVGVSTSLAPSPSPSTYPTSIPRRATPTDPGKAPDLVVEYSLTPNRDIRLGSVVVVRLRIENRGDDASDVVAISNNGSHVRWEMVVPPAGNAEVDQISVPPNRGNGTLGVAGVLWRLGLMKSGAVVELSYSMRVVDFPCRGGGDYKHWFAGGHAGPIRSGPNTFAVFVFIENDPEDIGALKPDANCEPISVERL